MQKKMTSMHFGKEKEDVTGTLDDMIFYFCAATEAGASA
jgi:hypothetical protein